MLSEKKPQHKKLSKNTTSKSLVRAKDEKISVVVCECQSQKEYELALIAFGRAFCLRPAVWFGSIPQARYARGQQPYYEFGRHILPKNKLDDAGCVQWRNAEARLGSSTGARGNELISSPFL